MRSDDSFRERRVAVECYSVITVPARIYVQNQRILAVITVETVIALTTPVVFIGAASTGPDAKKGGGNPTPAAAFLDPSSQR